MVLQLSHGAYVCSKTEQVFVFWREVQTLRTSLIGDKQAVSLCKVCGGLCLAEFSLHLTSFSSSSSLVFVQVDADSFYTACNGRQFNSIEDAVCQLVYVERAEVIKSEEVNVSLTKMMILKL